jgi:integrase
MRKLCEKAGVKYFTYHSIRHLTATVLYHKGYSLSHIQAVLRHKNPNTTRRYLRTLGLEQVRIVLEEGLKGPAEVIQFKKGTPGKASSEG